MAKPAEIAATGLPEVCRDGPRVVESPPRQMIGIAGERGWSWRTIDGAPRADLTAIAFGAGVFVAAAERMAVSTDGDDVELVEVE